MMRLVLFCATEISNSFPSLRMSSESITTQRRKGKVKKRRKERKKKIFAQINGVLWWWRWLKKEEKCWLFSKVGGSNAVRYKALSTGVPLTNAFGEVCSRGQLFASCLWWQKTLEPVFRSDRFQTLFPSFFFSFSFYRLPYYSSKYVLETRIEKDPFLPCILFTLGWPLLHPVLFWIIQSCCPSARFSKASIDESKEAYHLIQLLRAWNK